MKDVFLSLLDRPILRLVRGSTCCGVKTTTVRPVSARVQGVAQTKKPKSFTSTSYRATCCGLWELSSPTA